MPRISKYEFINMLFPYLSTINSTGVILRSESPRRKMLCEQLGLVFEIKPSMFPEDYDYRDFPSAQDYVLFYAREKSERSDLITISADTVVEYEGVVLEKAHSDEEAGEMLRRLSNTTHNVHTGLVVRYKDMVRESVVTTQVVMDTLSEDVIKEICNRKEYVGKSGAYGIQDSAGGSLIKEIRGCYYNVMGLPINTLSNHLVSLINEAGLVP